MILKIILILRTFLMLSYDTVIARVYPVHLMNVEQLQVAADSQTKLTSLGCESACRLLSHHHHPSFTI